MTDDGQMEFSDAPPPKKYPDAPGYKEQGGTSQDAAETIDENWLINTRREVLKVLSTTPLTADEMAVKLDVNPFAMRPRMTELFKKDLIRKTDDRRPNTQFGTGALARVWDITDKGRRLLRSVEE